MESQILQSEEVLRAKQEEIKNFIKANYGQILDRQKEIQQVEAELMSLQMEAKQTVNPRKQALEFLRKKIEQQGERAAQAKAREAQAKKAYEHAVKVSRGEEEEKARLSKELQALVQETASSQLERLEQLTRRLELLSGGAHSLLSASPQSAQSFSTSNGLLADFKEPDKKAVRAGGSANGPPSANSNEMVNGTNPNDEYRADLSDSSSKQYAKVAKNQPKSVANKHGDPMSRTTKTSSLLITAQVRSEGTVTPQNQWTGGGFDVQ